MSEDKPKSAYQMANEKAVKELPTLQQIVDKMGGNDKDPSDWMDSHGACKICGGEIPHGHAGNCIILTMEKKIKDLEKSLNEEITESACLTVDKEVLEAENAFLRKKILEK